MKTMSAVVYMAPTIQYFSYLRVGSAAGSCFDANSELLPSPSLSVSRSCEAMKSDRKRLKAEKADLVNQMQQLYATLESREEQLRDFIRNYEQHRKVWRTFPARVPL